MIPIKGFLLPKVTIRIHIFTYIILLISLLVILFAGMQYHFSKELALEATQKNFHLITTNIAADIKNRDNLSKEMIYQMQNYPEIIKPLNDSLNFDLVRRYVFTLKRHQNIVALYSTNSEASFIEVLNIKHSQDLNEYFKAPDNTVWLAYTIRGKGKERIKHLYFLDATLGVIGQREEVTNYIPQDRSWYKMAMKTEEVVRGAPYLFETLNERGITYAKKIKGTNIVMGLDLSLENIEESLKKLQFADSSEIVLFGSDGLIIGTTNSNKGYDHDLIKIFLKAPSAHSMMLALKETSRFTMVSRISSARGYDTYVAVSVLKNEMFKPYIDKIVFALFAVLGLLIVSIPFTLFVTNIIVRPIYALMKENKKIIERDFENVVEVKSNIIELDRLSHSLLEMSQSIHSYQMAQEELMDGFIRLIANAIDAKSPYTGGHCRRVPLIASLLVQEASRSKAAPFKAFSFESKEELEEFERGAWLHDCGKITTPEYVVDKATKLETIYNRIHEVRMRFEVLWRDISIVALDRQLAGESLESLLQWRHEEHQKLIDDFSFIATCNIGGEFMSEEKKARVKKIADRTWTRHFDNTLGLSDDELLRYGEHKALSFPVEERLLSDRSEHIVARVDFDAQGYKEEGFKLEVPEYLYNYGEIYNLCIERGTLSEEERFKIQEHVIMSIKMLEQLPFPEEMKRIPEYAGTHHETLVGTGYPRALDASALSIPDRVMAIADIFEALTASDRPYKKGKTLSQSLKIMSFMVKDQHIDGELFALFLRSGIYEVYAKEYLKPEQIDEVDIASYLS